ncbi:MAG: NAD(P)/FAD-dependent oxidoreductase [Thermoanaerobacteraceae bacterium]|nr:NAD(P)/FAD-dependent oxidoreductase [Thermoanaerobacteraceae bacterium]
MGGRRYVILGNGPAGVAAAEALRRSDRSASLTVVSDEPYPPYSRCRIPEIIAGQARAEDLTIRPPDFYQRLEVEPVLGKRAVEIDPERGRVVLEDGSALPYDALLVATGARPVAMGIPGDDLRGVFTLRAIRDAEEIARTTAKASSAVVIGGGMVSLKAAVALRKRGLAVTVVVKSRHLLSRQVDSRGAALVEQALAAQGIDFVFGQNPAAFEGKGGELESVLLEDGTRRPAQLAVVGKGVVPNVELARAAGVRVERGIAVNQYLETNVPGIYAAGDVCQVRDVVTGEEAPSALWTLAVEQGRLAGLNMAGRRAPYGGGLTRLNAVDLGGLALISAGLANAHGEGFQVLEDLRRGNYRRLVLRNGRLVGALHIGDISRAGVYTALIRGGARVEGLEEELRTGRLTSYLRGGAWLERRSPEEVGADGQVV